MPGSRMIANVNSGRNCRIERQKAYQLVEKKPLEERKGKRRMSK